MMVNFRKIFHLILLVLFASFSFGTNAAFASTDRRQDVNVFTFTELGVDSDIVLKGPYESRSIKFDLPPNWVLQDGAEINLEISAYFAIADNGQSTSLGNNFTGALLDVYFNEGLQQSVPLTNTENSTYRIPISAKDLVSTNEGGSHSITLALDAAIDCDLDFHKTTIVIKNNSFVILPRSEVSLDMDLRRLPWPIYQQKASAATSVMVVLPDSPSADEMQAGLVVMGAFGRMTSGQLPMSLILNAQLTEDLMKQSDLIFIGKPAAFQALTSLTFPLPLLNGQFSSPEIKEDDGVLQIISSPWNNSKSVLLVSGPSDAGVVKAAQALSSGNLQTGINSAYSVIAQVNPLTLSGGAPSNTVQTTSPDIAFSGLGYPAVTVDALGPNYFTYEFIIPPGQVPSENPYVEFRFSNSSLIDPARSDFAVFLNDIVVGSVQLSEGTSSFTTAKIDLPASILRFGANRLDLVINLVPRDECSVLAFSGLWATIFPDSFLHLPLVKAPDSISLFQDLKSYPYPFATDSSFGNTTFVLPEKNPDAWVTAGKIAYDLGARVDGSMLSFETAFDGQVPESAKSGNLIVVGEPKDLPILTEMKTAMPAYFEEKSNVAILETQLVIYRVSEQKSLGYLEIFNSPWSPQAAVLGVFGTNLNGLGHAVNSIVNFQIRETLTGNFSTYDGGNRAIVVDTRTGLGIGRFESSLGSENVTSQPSNVMSDLQTGGEAPVKNFRPSILFGIASVVVAIVVVAIFALRFGKKKA